MLRISEINYSVEGRPLFEEASAVIPESFSSSLAAFSPESLECFDTNCELDLFDLLTRSQLNADPFLYS